VKTLEVNQAKRVYRMECEPGQEAQIDYGTLSYLLEADYDQFAIFNNDWPAAPILSLCNCQ